MKSEYKKGMLIVAFNILFAWIIINMILCSVNSYADISKQKIEKKEIIKEIAYLTETKNRNKKEIENYQRPETLERFAREKLNMAKEGEVIYRYIE